MNKEEVQIAIKELFSKKVQKDSKIHNGYLLVHSDKLGLHLNLAEGLTQDIPASPQQPYFIASIGKLFTSVLIGILVEKEMISYEDTIDQYIEENIRKDLHIYKGLDYTDQIKVKHLLNHTSGVHDYFSDKPREGKPMQDRIFDEPSRFWKPQEVISWSKKNLKAHFPPGKGFHYSDTGYHVLGLVIEKVTQLPFHQALRDYILQPLGMTHTYMPHYSDPIEKMEFPIASLYGRGININQYRSLSIDYAGGGIAATAEDLLKFMKSLVSHKIISKDTFHKMQDWAGFFNLSFMGIDYGYGLMNFKAIPLLVPKKYNVWGNMGSTGSFMFYHPQTDAYFIGSLNQFGYYRKGIQLMFKAIDLVLKCEEQE